MLHLRNLKVIVWMLIIAICFFGGMATAGGPPAKKIGPNSDVQMRSASIGATWHGYGTGSPEGVYAAAVGSTYFRTDGGAGTTFYIKESGTGNTGWIAMVSGNVTGATINDLAGNGVTDQTWSADKSFDELALKQNLDSDLTAIAALTTTSYGRAFLALANQAALVALLPSYQAASAALTTYAGITPSTDVQAMLAAADNAAILTAINAQASLGTIGAAGGYMVEESALGVQGLGPARTSYFDNEQVWSLFYSDGSGDIQPVSIGSVGYLLTSAGTGGAPTWTDPATLGGGVSTSSPIGATAFTDLTPGSSYTNFGAAGDDTINELFAAVDTAIGALSGGHDAVTINAGIGAIALTGANQVLTAHASLEALVDNSALSPTWSNINPTFGTVTAASFVSNAADGAHYLDVINSVAITATATEGRAAYYNGRMRLADGTDWDGYLLEDTDVGVNVLAYDVDYGSLGAGIAGLVYGLGNGNGYQAATRANYAVMDTVGSFASPTTTNPYSLPAANCYGATVYYGATGEIDLPAGVDGMNVIIYNTGAFTITIDPNGTEIIVRDGTAQTGGVTMTLSSGAGNYVALVFDGARWVSKGYKGTLAEGT